MKRLVAIFVLENNMENLFKDEKFFIIEDDLNTYVVVLFERDAISHNRMSGLDDGPNNDDLGLSDYD